jgi:hypothetical protein
MYRYMCLRKIHLVRIHQECPTLQKIIITFYLPICTVLHARLFYRSNLISLVPSELRNFFPKKHFLIRKFLTFWKKTTYYFDQKQKKRFKGQIFVIILLKCCTRLHWEHSIRQVKSGRKCIFYNPKKHTVTPSSLI